MNARQLVGRPARAVLQRFGYDVKRRDQVEPFPVDYDQAAIDLFREVEPFTLTSHERVNALRSAVEYVVEAGIGGAFVECGVWRGGSMLAVAKTLMSLGAADRDLYLFDTFTTMPPPGDEDVDAWGNRAADFYDEALAHPGFSYLPMERVRELLLLAGYAPERLHLVPGLVEDTIPDHAPDQIALCRLDTDWYVSTKHELEHLFPRIADDGVLIVDDYGQFMGAKQAVDEYLNAIGGGILLNRIDFTGRLAVVTGEARNRAARRWTSETRERPPRERVANFVRSPST